MPIYEAQRVPLSGAIYKPLDLANSSLDIDLIYEQNKNDVLDYNTLPLEQSELLSKKSDNPLNEKSLDYFVLEDDTNSPELEPKPTSLIDQHRAYQTDYGAILYMPTTGKNEKEIDRLTELISKELEEHTNEEKILLYH